MQSPNGLSCCRQLLTCVGTELLNRLAEGQEVTDTLAHLLAVKHQMAVDTETPRPELPREQGQVVIQSKGEMVVDEILVPSVRTMLRSKGKV